MDVLGAGVERAIPGVINFSAVSNIPTIAAYIGRPALARGTSSIRSRSVFQR
jgi:hypothetical protein